MKKTLLALLVVGQAPLAAIGSVAQADEGDRLQFNTTASSQASVTYGPYMRVELGGAMTDLSDAYWLPPGPGDPQINFDLGDGDVGFGSLAFGFDWQNGIRADVALVRTGEMGLAGPCVSASDGSPCDSPPAAFADQHADISGGSVHSNAMMVNVFYSPLEARGSNSTFQPYIVGGLGFARNTVDSWTRVNPASAQPTRIFGSNTESDFAWSFGVGASWQLTDPGEWPVLLDISWRYYDFGTAVGGATADVGSGVPRQPLTFDMNSQVFSIGIRVPLQRL